MFNEVKRWWKSKTIWAMLVSIAVAGYNAYADQTGKPHVPDYVLVILASFGLYGRVKATDKIGKP